MSRKPTIRTAQFPYHITSRSNNKEWFYIDSEKVWYYFCGILHKGASDYSVKIHAFVLMANHYHILLRTPQENIDKFMRYFNKSLGHSIARASGRINRIFGCPYKWSLINKNEYYENVYRYIYQNPIRAHLASQVEDYPYSSLSKGKINNIIDEKDIMFENYRDLTWLNGVFSEDEALAVKKGLRRVEFRPGRDEKNWKRKIIL